MSAARPQDAHVPEVIWHDVECGAYAEDLPLWRDLAISHGGPVLDVGAGTGRVSLAPRRPGPPGRRARPLRRPARRAARARGGGLPIETVAADARDFDLGERRFGLILVPCRPSSCSAAPTAARAFLRRARARAARPAACSRSRSPTRSRRFDEVRCLPPMPGHPRDRRHRLRQPAGRGARGARRRGHPPRPRDGRHRRAPHRRGGPHHASTTWTPATLEAEGAAAGFRVSRARAIPETDDYVGSTVVMLRG